MKLQVGSCTPYCILSSTSQITHVKLGKKKDDKHFFYLIWPTFPFLYGKATRMKVIDLRPPPACLKSYHTKICII